MKKKIENNINLQIFIPNNLISTEIDILSRAVIIVDRK